MIRALAGLALALLATAATAQEASDRPEARPVAATSELTAAPRPEVRPAPEGPASEPSAPPAPRLRPGGEAPALAVALVPAMRPALRPYDRPELAYGANTRPIFRADLNLFAFDPNLLRVSLRPTTRPAAIVQRAVEQRVARQRGQVCGDIAIQGEAIGRVNGAGSCGIDSAVRVRSVAGVTLQPPATIDCRTAGALKAWVAQGVKPAVGQSGGGVASLRVVSHYACRNRNNASNGRLSEHSFGRAIDIAGIRLRSGVELTVLTDWNRGAAGQALRAMWRAACGPFGTVLGPNANRFHRDHFHFDTARYRSGSYCR